MNHRIEASKRKGKRIQQIISSLILGLFSIESAIPIKLVKSIIQIHFIILTLLMCDLRVIFEAPNSNYLEWATPVCIICSLLSLTIVAYILILVYCFKSSNHPFQILKILLILTTIFVYVIFPLTVGSATASLIQSMDKVYNSSSYRQFCNVISPIAIALGLGLTIVFILFMSSTVPNMGGYSRPDHTGLFWNYFLNLCSAVLAIFGYSKTGKSVNWTTAASLILLAISLTRLFKRKLFWHGEIALEYSSCALRMAFISFNVIIVNLGHLDKFYAIPAIICYIFSEKVATHLLTNLEMIDLSKINQNDSLRKEGLYYLQDCLSSKRPLNLEGGIVTILPIETISIHFLGCWSKIKNLRLANNPMVSARTDKENLIVYVQQLNSNDLGILEFLILLKLSGSMKYLTSTRVDLLKFKHLTENSLFGRIRYFYLRSILQCNLQYSYLTDEVYSLATEGCSISRYIDEVSQFQTTPLYLRPKPHPGADIFLALKTKKEYNQLVGMLEDAIRLLVALYTYLLRNPRLEISTLRSHNLEIYKINQRIYKKFANIKSEQTEGLGLYYYLGIAVYLVTARGEIVEGTSWYMKFKSRVKYLEYIIHRNSPPITALIGKTCSVLKVDMNPGNEGTIMDHTSEFGKLFSSSTELNFVGTNISQLMFDEIEKSHLKKMKQVSSLNGLIHPKPCFITCLDGLLNEATINVKLCPTTVLDVSAVTSIVLCDKLTKIEAVFQDDFSLVAGSKWFWQTLAISNKPEMSPRNNLNEDQSEFDLNHLGEISWDIIYVIKSIILIKNLKESQGGSLESDDLVSNKPLFMLIEQMNEVATSSGLLLDFGHDSKIPGQYTVKWKFSNILGNDFYQVEFIPRRQLQNNRRDLEDSKEIYYKSESSSKLSIIEDYILNGDQVQDEKDSPFDDQIQNFDIFVLEIMNLLLKMKCSDSSMELEMSNTKKELDKLFGWLSNLRVVYENLPHQKQAELIELLSPNHADLIKRHTGESNFNFKQNEAEAKQLVRIEKDPAYISEQQRGSSIVDMVSSQNKMKLSFVNIMDLRRTHSKEAANSDKKLSKNLTLATGQLASLKSLHVLHNEKDTLAIKMRTRKNIRKALLSKNSIKRGGPKNIKKLMEDMERLGKAHANYESRSEQSVASNFSQNHKKKLRRFDFALNHKKKQYQDFLVWLLYLLLGVTFILYFIMLERNTSLFYRSNLEYFKIADSQSRLIYQSLSMTTKLIDLYQTVFVTYYNTYFGYPIPVRPVMTEIYNNTDYMTYMMDTFNKSAVNAILSLSNLKLVLTETSEQETTQLNKILYGNRIDLKMTELTVDLQSEYNFTNFADASQYIPSMFTTMMKIYTILQGAVKILLSKTPITNPIVISFFRYTLDPSQYPYGYIIYNMTSKLINDMIANFNFVRDFVVNDGIKNYESNFYWTLFVLLGVILGITLLFIYVGLYRNKKIWRIYDAYMLLKPYEIENHIEEYESTVNLYQKHKYNEVELLSKYTTTFVTVKGPPTNISKKKKFGKNYYKSSKHRSKFINKSALNPSVSYSFLTVAIVLLFYGATILISIESKRVSKKIIDLQNVYLTTFSLYFPISKNILSGILFTVYGNYFKMDDRYVEENIYNNSYTDFANYWSQNAVLHSELFGSKMDRINLMLNRDLCGLIRNDTNLSKQSYAYCRNISNVFGAKGMRSYLQIENIISEKIYNLVIQNNSPSSINRTKTKFDYMNLAIIYDKDSARMRQGHPIIYEALFDTITDIVLTQIEGVYDDLLFLQSITQYYITPATLLFLLLSILYGDYLRRRDSEVAYSTYRNINPAVIMNNPYILNEFKILFAFE